MGSDLSPAGVEGAVITLLVLAERFACDLDKDKVNLRPL